MNHQKDSSLVVKFESWYETYEIDSLETMLEDGSELVSNVAWYYFFIVRMLLIMIGLLKPLLKWSPRS